MNLGLGLLRSEFIELDLNAGFSDLRLPYTTGRSMKIGGISTWERNRVSDTSVDMSLLDGRLAYQSSYFWSQYVRDSKDNTALTHPDQGNTGAAHWHKAEATLLRDEGMSASVYGLYRDINPEFRSLRERSVSVFSATGEKRRFGGHPTLTPNRKTASEIAKSFRAGTYWKPGATEAAGRFGEFGGQAKLGRFELTGRMGSSDNRYPDNARSNPSTARAQLRYRQSALSLTAWSQQRSDRGELKETFGGSADLSIEEAFGVSGIQLDGLLAAVAPDNVSANWAHEAVSVLGTGHQDQTGQQLGFGLDWEWDNGVSTASISHYFSDNDGRSLTAAGSNDYSLDASHTMFGEAWDLTLYAAANQATFEYAASTSSSVYLGAGASLWLGFDKLPDFVANVDFNEFSSEEILLSDLYRDVDVTISFDFSKYIRADEKDRRTFMKLSHHVQGITYAEGDSYRDEEISHAIVFSYGAGF